MPKETFKEIAGFEEYLISDAGRVINQITDHFKTPTTNQQGIPNVLLVKDRLQHRRSVAVLVANAFLEPMAHDWIHFDTPINLNGNRLDCRVENLAWRPRWFAVKFHKERRAGSTYEVAKEFYEVDTEDVFRQPCEAAMRWGLLEYDILDSIITGETVFPDWQQFKFVEEDPLGRY